jgi:endonuclease III
MNKQQINEVFQTLYKDNPEPKIELEYNNAFTLLTAIVLSAQTSDKMVNSVTKDIFPHYNTPTGILALGYEGLMQRIKKIGLYRSKTKNIINLCHMLIRDYGGQVPDSFQELIKLPGVGRKTADVMLNSYFGQKTIAVDRHVYRVSRRLGLCKANTVEELADRLPAIIPSKWHKYAHHWLVLHGRYICKAPKPSCHLCTICHLCQHYAQNK